MQEEEIKEILELGKGVLNHISYVPEKGFRLSKRIKGYHCARVVKNEIVRKKIEKVREYLISKGCSDTNRSVWTKSIYMFSGEVPVRISDHPKATFNGTQYIVGLKTDINEFLKNIILP